jgi:hypothetical protein
LLSRVATGSSGTPESIRALIRSDPSLIQQDLRLFDFDIRTGPTASLDAIGVDRSGSLALVVISTGDPEAALARVLDGHLWAADQGDLLGRLYAERGVDAERPAIGFLLSPSFTHPFLRRLSLLSVRVTPCLAREIDAGNGDLKAIVEPAGPLFGLDTVEPRAQAEAEREARQPFWPEGVLPSGETETMSRGIRPVVADAEDASGAPAPTIEPEQAADMPWPDAPEERFPWEVDEAGAPPAPIPSDDEPALPGTFETLTIEELEEFERFERQRLDRGRGSS